MDPRVNMAIDGLVERGRRRGFVTMAEVQQELETVEASGSAFDKAVEAARKGGVKVLEDGSDNFDPPMSDEDLLVVSDPVRMYLKQIGRAPLLNAQQEVELSMAIEAGSEAKARLAELETGSSSASTETRGILTMTARKGADAENRLVESNLRLVVSIAKRYVGNGLPLLDLIQEGNLGLMKAVHKFDYRRGFRFSTYATWWIRQAVSRSLADYSRTIRVPVHMVETIHQLAKAQRRLFQKLGREPTIEEIGREIEIPPSKVIELSRISQGTLSLETPVSGTDAATLGDFIADDSAEVPVEGAAFKLLQEYVAQALEGLSERERQVILMRFGLSDGRVRTLEELSAHFDLTRERIRQLETRALVKLRRNSDSRRLEGYLRDA